jgi:hypothetical protein
LSEYQYYEFQAVDRPLTAKEMAELRSFSTRARITPTTFVNDYSWGNFKGDEDAWMDTYFDAFLYVANWGTRVLKLGLPNHLLDAKTARRYCAGQRASVRDSNGRVILTFVTEDDEDGDWIDGEGWLSSIVSVRGDVARGDLRALYLGWLLGVQHGDVDDGELEPPIPHGLAQLDAPLDGVIQFLRIDNDLVAAAAGTSGPLVDAEPKLKAIRQWVVMQPVAAKDDLLTRLMAGEAAVANELVRRMKREGGREAAEEGESTRRTAGELLRTAERLAAERRRSETETAARENARRDRAAAAARARHLNLLSGREPSLWRQVDELIATRRPTSYDEAVNLLVDLRDLSRRKDGTDFHLRLKGLRSEHTRKPSLIYRLDRTGL